MPDSGEIRAKPPCRREDALAVRQRLRDAGHLANRNQPTTHDDAHRHIGPKYDLPEAG